MPSRSVFISFLQLAQVWFLSCPYFDCFCPRKVLQVLWNHCLYICACYLADRQEKYSLSASFLKPDSHTFSTSKPHRMTSAGWHKWTLMQEIIHSVAFSICGKKKSHSLTFVGFNSLQSHFPYINLIWNLEWLMRGMYFFSHFADGESEI